MLLKLLFQVMVYGFLKEKIVSVQKHLFTEDQRSNEEKMDIFSSAATPGLRASQRVSDPNLPDLMQILKHLSELSLGLLTLIYHGNTFFKHR